MADHDIDPTTIIVGDSNVQQAPPGMTGGHIYEPDDKPRNVIEALARVTKELPSIGKDKQFGEDGSRTTYKYRGIEQITSEASVLFGRYGIVFAPKVLSAAPEKVHINASTVWDEWQLLVEYTVYGPGGKDDSITVGPFMALGRDNSDKGTNKALTQAFKQCLLQVLCVADEKDDGDRERAENRPPTVDELAVAHGWRDDEDRIDHWRMLDDTLALLDAETRGKFDRWVTRHNLAQREGWQAAYDKACEKADLMADPISTGPTAEPAPAQARPATGITAAEALPVDRGQGTTERALDSLARARLAHAGITTGMLTTPAGLLTPAQASLVIDCLEGPDGDTLGRWIADLGGILDPDALPGGPRESTQEAPEPSVAGDDSPNAPDGHTDTAPLTPDEAGALDALAVSRAPRELIAQITAECDGMDAMAVTDRLVQLGMDAKGNLATKRRRLVYRMVRHAVDAIDRNTIPDGYEATPSEYGDQ